MLSHTNIERNNSQQESKAPFTFESTLTVAGQRIPQGGFLSVKVYVDSNIILPVRIYCVRQNGEVVFCDKTGTVVALWKTCELTDPDIDYVTDLLFTEEGAIAGSIACTVPTLDIFRSLVTERTSDYFLPADAFVLIPQCHIAMMGGASKTIHVTDKEGEVHVFTSDITIQNFPEPEDYDDSEDMVVWRGYSANLKNTYDAVINRQPTNKICSIVIDGSTTWCDGKKLLIKAKMDSESASNLRIVHENGQLVMRGVNNA